MTRLDRHRRQVVLLDFDIADDPMMPSRASIPGLNGDDRLIDPNVSGLRRSQISRTLKE